MALKNNEFDFLHVYLISDFSHYQEIPITEQVEKALQGGVRAFQLREKNISPKELLARAIEIKPIIKKYGAKLFINDRADIAEIAGVSSFVYNVHGKNAVIFDDVQGYTLSTAIKKFDIPRIDILKTDCKGCEFFLTEEDLENVNSSNM